MHDREEAGHVDSLRGLARSVTGIAVSRPARLAAAAFALGGDRPLTHVLLHSPKMAPALRTLVETVQPDVVVAYCTAMARYALEPPLAGLPWILDMVDVDSEKWRSLAGSKGPMGRIYDREARLLRAFERRAMALAAATTIVSVREQVLLSEIAPGSTSVVVPNGIDLQAFRPSGPPAEARAVIFCGVFNYGPNEEGARWLATEIWPLVTAEVPEATLWLVGMHPTRAVTSLSENRSVRVTGAVPQVQPFLWRSAVAAAPLLLARGVQNKVLEALAAGLPCVVTPQVMEGLPDAVKPGCREAAGARQFAAALVELLRMLPEERRRLAARAEFEGLGWGPQLAPMLRLVAAAANGTSAALAR